MARQGILPRPGSASQELTDLVVALERVIDRRIDQEKLTAGAEAADARRVSLQVRDRLGADRTGRYLVRVWVSTASRGAPAGAQAVAVVTGTVIQTVAANQDYLILSDAAGLVEVDITIVGAATRWVSALVVGDPSESAQLDWS